MGLPEREGGEGPGRAVLWFRGTRRVNQGALQRGLLWHWVAKSVDGRDRSRVGTRVRLLLGLWAWPGPAAGPGVSRSPCLCVSGSLRNGDSFPLRDGGA